MLGSKHGQQEERVFTYTPEQMFDLIADVERYPEFVPGWSQARITGRRDNRLYVNQAVGVPPLQWHFCTEAVLARPEHIHIRATSGPFDRFDIHWRFLPGPTGGCRVAVAIDVRPGSALLSQLMRPVLHRSAGPLLAAFTQRAHQLYGESALPDKRDET